MKENKYAKFIWGGIVLAVLFMVWPFKKDDTKPIDVQEEVRKADSMRNDVSFKFDTIKQIDKNILIIEAQHDSILSLRRTIKMYESKFNQQNEKANNVPKLSTDELVKFLSERYKDELTRK